MSPGLRPHVAARATRATAGTASVHGMERAILIVEESTARIGRAASLTVFLQAAHRGHTPLADTTAEPCGSSPSSSARSAPSLAVRRRSRWAGEPTSGTLSVERGKGVVMIDLRGSVLGRLSTGTLRVTDQTPNDKYTALVAGTQAHTGTPRAEDRAVSRPGPALPDARWRVPDGRARIRHQPLGRRARHRHARRRCRASRATTSACTRATASIAAPSRLSCTALPTEPERFALEPPPADAEPEEGAVTTPTTILVVEDETSIASFVAAYLRNAGYGVKTAATAQSGA